MAKLGKVVVGAVAIFAGVSALYQARQAVHLRGQIQTLLQQQAPLAEQLQRLQRERDEALRQLASLHDDDRLNRDAAELLRLRGEVGVLRRQTSELEKLQDENRELQQPSSSAAQTPARVTQAKCSLDRKSTRLNSSHRL